VYELPFLAHATMEPINCTIHLQADSCDLWLGTQVPTFVLGTVTKMTGLAADKTRVHNQLLGGGFGHRLEVDSVIQAVQIAKQVQGPVKIVLTREEDIQHDRYRPYYYDKISASLDSNGMPEAWNYHITGSSIISGFAPMLIKDGVDPDAVEAATDLQYAIPNVLVIYVRHEPPFTTAFWHGAGPTHNVFVVESFIDQLGAKEKKDPYEYRRSLLANSPRANAVLELAAAKANRSTPLAQPKEGAAGRGISLLFAFGSYIAQGAEVVVSKDNEVTVTCVVSAVDCGMIMNPDKVKAQLEGGVMFGIITVLWAILHLKMIALSKVISIIIVCCA